MVNFIRIDKDHDDINVTVQFSGRDEWLTFRQLLTFAYVNAKEISEEGYKIRPAELKDMFDKVNDLVNELDVGE